MRTIMILVGLLVIIAASVVAYCPGSVVHTNTYVSVETAREVRQASPCSAITVKSEPLVSLPQDRWVANDPGFIYSYQFPKIYPRSDFFVKSDTSCGNGVTRYVDACDDRTVQYVFDEGCVQNDHKAYAVNAIPRSDRCCGSSGRFVYDHGPRMDVY